MLNYFFKELVQSKKLYKTEEYKYFIKNNYIFKAYPCLKKYLKFKDDIDLIKINILIRSLHNKVKMETNKKENLLFFTFEDTPIYLPIFSVEVNKIYYDIENLNHYPYNLLVHEFKDLLTPFFATYGSALLTSSFVDFVELMSDSMSSAYLHRSFQIIYIISTQGSVEYKIPLFDDEELRYEDNLVENAKKVVEAYYSFDKIKMVEQLFIHRFISYDLYDRLIFLLKVEVKKK